MTGIWKLIGEMPSTNVRIAVSMLMALATAVRVVGFSWEPPIEWLGFLTVWAGLDVAQFGKNRTTDYGYVAANKPTPISSTSTLTQPDGTVSETVTTPVAPTVPVKVQGDP